jgi:uncharacterized protein (DUF302 family)
MKKLIGLKPLTTTMVAFILLTLFSFQQANAQNQLVTVKSAKSFDATIEGIKKAVAGSGMMVMSELNQGKMLSMTGLSIKAESLFIGNPNVGKEAFTDNPAVGLAIPVRLNVYEQNGATYINYITPSSDLGNFTGNRVKMIGQELDKKMAMLTGMFK